MAVRCVLSCLRIDKTGLSRHTWNQGHVILFHPKRAATFGSHWYRLSSYDARFHSLTSGCFMSLGSVSSSGADFIGRKQSHQRAVWPATSSVSCHGHLFQARFRKRNRGNVRPSTDQNTEVDEEDDDDDDDDEDITDEDDFGRFFKEDDDLPNNYREIKVYVKSLRLDSVISSALNIARNKVDDMFLGSHLLHNGSRAHKKSEKVQDGDFIDVITSYEEDHKMKVKRIRIVNISSTKSAKERTALYLRVWKGNVLIDNYTKAH